MKCSPANVEIENFLIDLHTVDAHLVNYLVTSDSDSLLNYHKYKEIFTEKVQNMFPELQDIRPE